MTKAKRINEDKVDFEYDLLANRKRGTTLDKIETAAYVSDILLQLRNMAKAADLKFLVYFLEMAFQEAFSQSTRADGSKPVEDET